MTRDQFIELFLNTTNELRRLLGERLLTYQDLEQVGMTARPCDCQDPTCPGWGMAFEKREQH
jgi:hypothetical protein